MVETAHESLHAQLAEHGEDVALWGVYGDLLQSESNVHGPLVTLMLERERVPSQGLLDAELAYRAQHLEQLLPPSLRRHPDAVAWRRGFPVDVAIASLATLEEVIADPAMRFVEAAHLTIDAEDLAAWFEVLARGRLPWARVRLTIADASEDDELELAPLFASMPALEQLRIAFGEYDNGRLAFGGVVGPRLRQLAVEFAAELVDLETAELPVLEELRLLGTALPDAVVDSKLWDRLARVVATPDIVRDARSGPAIIQHERADDDDFDSPQDAFIAIRQLVDAELVEELAATLPGLEHLNVTIGHVELGRDPFTVVRLRGSGATQLMPYGFAVLLESKLPPKTALVAFHTSSSTGTARAFALGSRPLRRSDGESRADALVRAMFDFVIGHDVGIGILADLDEALACGRMTTVIGAAMRDSPVLCDVDPAGLGPLPELDDFMDPPPENELDLYSPPPEEAEPAIDDDEHEAASLVAVIEERDDDADDAANDDTGEIALDGSAAWARTPELAERIAEPAEEQPAQIAELDVDWELPVDPETLTTDGACASCDEVKLLLWSCTWCGGRHCANCAVQDEDDRVWCARCITELEAGQPGAHSPSDVIDDETAPVDAELDDDLDDDELDDDELDR